MQTEHPEIDSSLEPDNLQAQAWLEPCPYINFALVLVDGVKFSEDERLNFLLNHYQSCPQCLALVNDLKADLSTIDRMIPFGSAAEQDEKRFLERLERYHRPGIQWDEVQDTTNKVLRDIGIALVRPRFLAFALGMIVLWFLFSQLSA